MYHHIGLHDFGKEITPFTEGTPLYNLIMGKTVKDDFTSQLMFLEAYDETFGIFDHATFDHNDPMSIIAMHPSEDMVTGSRLVSYSRELMACRIPELTNKPIDELMRLPKWYLDDLLKDGRKARHREDAEVEKMQADLKASAEAAAERTQNGEKA